MTQQLYRAELLAVCRMLFGFSRDQAVPFWWIWQKVDSSSGVPYCAGWQFLIVLYQLSCLLAVLSTTCAGCPVCLHALAVLSRRLCLNKEHFEGR